LNNQNKHHMTLDEAAKQVLSAEEYKKLQQPMTPEEIKELDEFEKIGKAKRSNEQ